MWAVRLSLLENACSRPLFPAAILTRKVGQTNLIFGLRSDLLIGLCMQDYKTLCAVVTICSTLVNIQAHIYTHRQHFDQLISEAQPAVSKK